jgi:hypothetical protein
MKITVLRDALLFNLIYSCQRFCETLCFHRQSRGLCTLKMVAENSIETLIIIKQLYSVTS